MKLAILTLDFAPQMGGVQNYLYEMAQGLGARHEVCVLTPVGGKLPSGVTFERQVLPKRLWPWLRALWGFRPDYVLVGHAHPFLLLIAWLAAHCRYATMTHGNDFLAAQRCWHRLLTNHLLAASHPLLTNSNANGRRLAGLGIAGAQVIYPATDPARFSPAAHPPTRPGYILSLGRLVLRKGMDTLIRAYADLQSEFPDVRLVIAGDGPDRERLQNMAASIGAEVDFRGRVPAEDLSELYRRALLFALPAREEPSQASVEGFGIVYLEASASGIPVVAGRSGGAVEAVREGETGLLVPPNDVEALAEALRSLLRDKDLRRRLGEAGRQWVAETMNWSRAVADMERALRFTERTDETRGQP